MQDQPNRALEAASAADLLDVVLARLVELCRQLARAVDEATRNA
jgi:hypothetical protein